MSSAKIVLVFLVFGITVMRLEGAVLGSAFELFERYPSLAGLSKLLNEDPNDWATETQVDQCFDMDDGKLNEIFKYVRNDRKSLNAFLDKDSCQKERSDDFDFENLFRSFRSSLEQLKISPEFIELLSKAGTNFVTIEELIDYLRNKLFPVDQLAPENHLPFDANSSERLECYIDYAGFVKPITDRIFISVVPPLLETYVCPDIDDLGNRLICEAAAELIRIWPTDELPSWGGRMIDAMAKIPTTIIEGRLSWVGAYDLCQNYKVTYNYTGINDRSFNGKYCRLDMTSFPEENSTAPAVTLQFGICVPDTCNSGDVNWYITQNNTILKAVQLLLGLNITYVYCGMENLDGNSDPALQAALGITIFFLIMVVIATIYDGCFRKSIMKKRVKELNDCVIDKVVGTKEDREDLLDEKPFKIRFANRAEMLFVGFSAYTNWRKIFTIRDKPGDIPVLNGIRYLSYVYVMWGNTYVFGPIYFEAWVTANVVGALPRLTQNFIFQPIINFHLAEDSFLLISGILVTYWFLRRFEENGSKLRVKSIIYYFVHRYWRLMPAMMLGIMIFTCTYKYAADGPLYPPKDTDGENCRINWWVDLLMVHNIVKVSEQCFGHAWFVPLVFQLHVAAIVVVIPLVLFPVVGYVMIAVMYVAHIGATAGISTDLRNNRMEDWYNEYLLTPWCRAGPFIIGLAFGILFHKRRHLGIRLHWAVNLLLWVIAMILVLLPAFASYSEYKDGGERWSTDALIAYDTLARSSWALGLAWIALACHFKHGGVIESFLTWRVWTPLSRLVYATMLIHGLMIFTWVYTSRQPIYIDQYHQMYALFGHLIYVMIVGLVVALIWDLPLATGVEKAIIAKNRFQWIRSGRHPRSDLEEVERRFWGVGDSDDKDEKKDPHFGQLVIPNCNYVEVNSDDIGKMGFSFKSKENHHHDSDKHSYDNPTFDKNEPEPDYETANYYSSIQL